MALRVRRRTGRRLGFWFLQRTTRTEAAKIGGVGLQIIRDWVLRFRASSDIPSRSRFALISPRGYFSRRPNVNVGIWTTHRRVHDNAIITIVNYSPSPFRRRMDSMQQVFSTTVNGARMGSFFCVSHMRREELRSLIPYNKRPYQESEVVDISL